MLENGRNGAGRIAPDGTPRVVTTQGGTIGSRADAAESSGFRRPCWSASHWFVS
jgi:hypothetical protein